MEDLVYEILYSRSFSNEVTKEIAGRLLSMQSSIDLNGLPEFIRNFDNKSDWHWQELCDLIATTEDPAYNAYLRMLFAYHKDDAIFDQETFEYIVYWAGLLGVKKCDIFQIVYSALSA